MSYLGQPETKKKNFPMLLAWENLSKNFQIKFQNQNCCEKLKILSIKNFVNSMSISESDGWIVSLM
jgi:hypothetical protein